MLAPLETPFNCARLKRRVYIESTDSNVEAACGGSCTQQIRPIISRNRTKESCNMALDLTHRLEVLDNEYFSSSATNEKGSKTHENK
jgi:hypothetical protein